MTRDEAVQMATEMLLNGYAKAAASPDPTKPLFSGAWIVTGTTAGPAAREIERR